VYASDQDILMILGCEILPWSIVLLSKYYNEVMLFIGGAALGEMIKNENGSI
jgi:hypothetical protein